MSAKEGWDIISRSYQRKTRISLNDVHYGPISPGEHELKLLGDVKNKDILELQNFCLIFTACVSGFILISSAYSSLPRAISRWTQIYLADAEFIAEPALYIAHSGMEGNSWTG